MGKQIKEVTEKVARNKKTKVNRLDQEPETLATDKHTWPTNAVVYIGHLPHGFLEDQMKSYFSQYGEVLAVKVGRSKITARSKGYAFLQFKYPEVAEIVSDTMNGYLLLGKVLVSNILNASQKNPFSYSSSAQYKYINWKRMFIQSNKQAKSEEQVAHLVHTMVKKEDKKRQKFSELGIDYQFPGFASFIPKEAPKEVTKKKTKPTKKSQKAK